MNYHQFIKRLLEWHTASHTRVTKVWFDGYHWCVAVMIKNSEGDSFRHTYVYALDR